MKTRNDIKTEVQNIIRNLGETTRHLWELYDQGSNNDALDMLGIIGDAQPHLVTLLKKLEDNEKAQPLPPNMIR